MDNFVGSYEGETRSPLPHRRPRRFSIHSNRCKTSLINNKDEEEIIQGDASIVFQKDGSHFHGIVQGKHGGGLCQILGKLNDRSSPAEIFSSSYDPSEEHTPRIYTTELFQNHFESKNLGSIEVLRNQNKCHIGSAHCKINFTSSQVYKGVNANKMIRSLLGPSFVMEGQFCYTGHIVIGFPSPPMNPILSSSATDSLDCFL